ncbi:class I SAM-dependent methyltransferase [Paenibacillus sp. KQZ6P-2]|uniref:Class I SAM-dependent methyltransferase n=2 Tax=Paenibacillus mangrovi TaxID=2931978 RepID=A0A9X2B458_9BACL|nr:class I SAM-dependent methyltransferase [Paenibacillus mangrovi]MCJ8014279.1 class I SAM-dependent methyltransferase [Paenibacillus mangrovi]
MFNLDERALSGRKILDCPGGACSFAAGANKHGSDVIAADIVYYHDTEMLYRKGIGDIIHAMEHVETEKKRYLWTEFQSVEELRTERIKALETCARDMRLHPERYIPVTLPVLPFEDGQFDMTLSAHFLFTYADRLDADFHLRTLRELFRVTRHEVRIFPLVDQSGRQPEHVDILICYARIQGWEPDIQAVPYHFQRNANHVLVLRKTEK